jgi:hypothetical protein
MGNVTAIAPGLVGTAGTRDTKNERREPIVVRNALKRLVAVEDEADTVEVLLSHEAKNITGTATLVTEDEFDLAEFRQYLMTHLPPYARPLFLRIRNNMDLTGPSKYSKTDLLNHGFDPVACNDPLYFDDLQSAAFIPLDRELYDRIQKGGIRI